MGVELLPVEYDDMSVYLCVLEKEEEELYFDVFVSSRGFDCDASHIPLNFWLSRPPAPQYLPYLPYSYLFNGWLNIHVTKG